MSDLIFSDSQLLVKIILASFLPLDNKHFLSTWRGQALSQALEGGRCIGQYDFSFRRPISFCFTCPFCRLGARGSRITTPGSINEAWDGTLNLPGRKQWGFTVVSSHVPHCLLSLLWESMFLNRRPCSEWLSPCPPPTMLTNHIFLWNPSSLLLTWSLPLTADSA